MFQKLLTDGYYWWKERSRIQLLSEWWNLRELPGVKTPLIEKFQKDNLINLKGTCFLFAVWKYIRWPANSAPPRCENVKCTFTSKALTKQIKSAPFPAKLSSEIQKVWKYLTTDHCFIGITTKITCSPIYTCQQTAVFFISVLIINHSVI